MRICPHCATPNQPTARFCRSCGRALTQTCTRCGKADLSIRAKFCSACRQPLGQAVVGGQVGGLMVGRVLANRYQVRGLLGAGGMATVYRVFDNRLSAEWAIKEMKRAGSSEQERIQAEALFQREAAILANLSHAGLPRVVDFFTETGQNYLVMELIQGEVMDDLLLRTGPPPIPQVLEWTEQICDVFDYLHSRNPPVIFRDLKPSNVMIADGNRVKLIDFGIARFLKVGQKTDTVALGTPGYAAPESYGKSQSDARSDIYSLGVLLHQMLSGYDPTRTPFALPSLTQLAGNLPPGLEMVVNRATHTQPDQRFATTVELKQALRHAGSTAGSVQPVSVPGSPSASGKRSAVVSPITPTAAPPPTQGFPAPINKQIEAEILRQLRLIIR